MSTKKNDKGVPPSGSGSPSKSSPKKAPGFPSDPSRNHVEPGTHAFGSSHGPSKSETMRQYVKEQYKQPTQATVNCPVCKGKGQLPHPKLGLRTDEGAGVALSIMAKALREQKYSLREIGKFLGYNSPRSVQMLLKKHGMK